MIKVAMIGAGSVVFSRTLTGDLLSHPEFHDATFTYMDVDRERLEVGAALCRKIAKSMGANPKIEATLDRREALRGADFVIVMVQVGGFDNTLVDFEIPRKYGLNFTIADTTGPGGLMRALRTYPFYRDLVRDALDVAPNAYILNYSNPMSMNMQAIYRNGHTRAVGLCHSVQGTFNQLMGYIGEKPSDIAFQCAGINHMAFYLKIAKNNVDLYPRLFAAMNDPKAYNTNKVRFELMRRLGYFVTESSEHSAEYCPYFIPHGKEYIQKYDVPIDEYLRRCDGIVDEFERQKKLAQSDEALTHRVSPEYGSQIIHSIATGTPRVVYGNMPNNGAISNMPRNAIAEVPTLVDRAGLQFTTVGELPPQLIAYMNPHITQHELFIRAAMEGRRDHLYQAAMFDPLTAASVPMDRIVDMVDELIAGHGFEGEGGFLPKLDAKKSLVPGSGKTFHPPTPKELRDSWDKAQKDADADSIHEWKIIGPFRQEGNTDAIKLLETPFEIEASITKDGAIDFSKSYTSGDKTLSWKTAPTSKRGFLNANEQFGRNDFCVAYGYAEVESVQPRECVIRCGSDDGIKLWLNGKLVHTSNTLRGFQLSDEVTVQLKAGINRLVVKVSQHDGGWGWGVSVPKANF
jgi:alpha-galactosidase